MRKYKIKISYMVIGGMVGFFMLGLYNRRKYIADKLFKNKNKENIIAVILPDGFSRDNFIQLISALNYSNPIKEDTKDSSCEESIRIKDGMNEFVKNAGIEAGKKMGSTATDIVVSFFREGVNK